MPAILYIETNFLLSFATGRDRSTDTLLRSSLGTILPAIPGLCFMEAFTVLKWERRKRDEEIRVIEGRIRATERNVMNQELVASLMSNLTLASKDILSLFSRFEDRLEEVVRHLSKHADLIETSADVLLASQDNVWIKDPADNLILACILRHATLHPTVTKALLTENRRDFERNPDAREALDLAGVKCFSDADRCSAWLMTQS